MPRTTIDQLDLERVRALRAAGHPFVVSYGLGVDSTAMLIGLADAGIRPDAILFADVGAEKSATYAYLETMNAWLASVGFPAVTVVRYETTERSATDPRTGAPYRDLEGQCLATGRLPSLAYRGKSCSIKWKATAQHRWLEAWQPAREAWSAGRTVIKAIGYDCSPADLKRGTFSTSFERSSYDYAYPLRWWSWTRDDCKRRIAKAGLPVPPKSSCFFCPAMKADELRDLAVEEPELLLRAIDLEDRARAAAEARVAAGGTPSPAELGGLWTFNRPSKREPTSWRAFAEAEGLLEIADGLVALAERRAAA